MSREIEEQLARLIETPDGIRRSTWAEIQTDARNRQAARPTGSRRRVLPASARSLFAFVAPIVAGVCLLALVVVVVASRGRTPTTPARSLQSAPTSSTDSSAASRSRAGGISGYGLSAVLPAGWRGRVTLGLVAATTGPLLPISSNYERSTSRAVRGDGVAFALVEDTPGEPGWSSSGYVEGAPEPLRLADFGFPLTEGTASAKNRHARRSFVASGRYFRLLVDAGPKLTRRRLAELNALLRSLRVQPGDFYPGTVEPARFAPAAGWSTKSSPPTERGPDTSTISVASTVPYQETLFNLPPMTLSRLPPDGIIIWVQLVANNEGPPIARGAVSRSGFEFRVPAGPLPGMEGAPNSASIQAIVSRQYDIYAYLFFGSRNPTPAQRARAKAELSRLTLPTWPDWPVR